MTGVQTCALPIYNNLLNVEKLNLWFRVYIEKNNIWNRFWFNILSIEDKIKWIEKNIKWFHFHFNTNNFNLDNYRLILQEVWNLIDKLNLNIEYIDIWWWLPWSNEFVYHNQVFEELPKLINEFFPNKFIISESWRYIVSNWIKLEANVISIINENNNKNKVNIDTNIMHFPCYFEKKYSIDYVVCENDSISTVSNLEIFGNSCMQIDKIWENIIIKWKPNIWDKVIINNIWAYSFSQAANFISLIPKFEVHENSNR